MASDDSSGGRPAAPIVIRIKLRYDDVEAMVQRFAANVGKSGLFLPTKALQPIGAEVKFELRLSDDTPALVGLGRVKAATPPDAEHPRAAFGMAIELMRVTPQSRALILRMLERRRALGLTEVALPMAADIEAARRAELATGPVPVVPPPPPAPSSSAPTGEGLMTAPRRTTAPMPVAKVMTVVPLAAEGPRRRRASMSELIEAAAGSVASALPGLDDDVDVGAVLARARVLVGGDLDAELEALAELVAAPVEEVSIEAASVALARQLGGLSMRDRSARWAPPPPTTTTEAPKAAEIGVPGEAPAPEAVVDVAPEAVEVAPEAIEAVEEAAPAPVELAPEPIEEVEPEAIEAVEAVEAAEPAVEEPPVPQLHELDMEDAEHTEMGAIPEPPPVEPEPEPQHEHEPDAATSMPMSAAEFGASIEAELAAEAEADELGLASALGMTVEGPSQIRYVEPDPEPREDSAVSAPHDLSLDEFDDFEILAEADAADEDLLTSNAERETSNLRAPTPLPLPIDRPSEPDFAARLDLGDDDDYDLAPAGTDVFDGGHSDPLLTSAGQALAGFETGDESIDDDRHFARDDKPNDLPRIIQPIFEPEQSSSYTLAVMPSDDSLDLDFGPAVRDRAAPRPTKLPPPSRAPIDTQRDARLPSLYTSPVEDDELEHALGALDVDLDDLALPQAGPAARTSAALPARATPPKGSRPLPAPAATLPPAASTRPAQPTPRAPVRTSAHVVPARPRTTGSSPIQPSSPPSTAPRVTTDDGLEIDFDDED